MQTLEPQAASKSVPLEEDKLLTRPLPGWLNVPNFLWLIGTLLALATLTYLLMARPVTVKTWDADNLTNAVEEKNDYRIFGAETDTGGRRFAWTGPKALFIVPASSYTNRPIKITVRARGASAGGGPVNVTRVKANGVPLGEIRPIPGAAQFQDFAFTLNPAYRDDRRVYLEFETPGWQPPGDRRGELGFALQAVTVDLGEVWSPLLRPGRVELAWALAGLALLLLALKVAQWRMATGNRLMSWGGVGLAGLAAALSLLWFGLVARVGYNGELNEHIYWLYAAGSLYLAAFFGWLAIAGWPIGKNPLLDTLTIRTQARREAHPVLTAGITIFFFNLAISGLFVGKIVLESGSLGPVFRYLDGPEYVVIANNFYDLKEPLLRISDFGAHSPFYWGAHFPGFSVALMLVKPFVGWIAAPLLVNFVASTLFAWVFYLLVRDFNYARHPLWLSLVALVLPVRWLIYHNVGSSEPLFMLFQILSVYWFKKERYWLAGLAGFGAVFTRPPGLFLWGGLMLLLLFEAAVKTWNTYGFSLPKLLSSFNWRAFGPLLLIPLGVVAVFGIYAWRYDDFWAYFKIEENVTHVGLLPLPTLLTGRFESPALILMYILQVAGLIMLWRQRRFDLFWVSFGAFFYTVFLTHSDVLRYSIPFFALAVLIPFAEYASGKLARWLAGPVLVAILFYSWGFFTLNPFQLLTVESFEEMKRILQIKS